MIKGITIYICDLCRKERTTEDSIFSVPVICKKTSINFQDSTYVPYITVDTIDLCIECLMEVCAVDCGLDGIYKLMRSDDL